jgi:hypothetical protein
MKILFLMLTKLISRIALSRYFEAGVIGKWYVGNDLHVFSEGDILVEVEPSDRNKTLKVKNFFIDAGVDEFTKLGYRIGMYEVEVFENRVSIGVDTFSKVYLERSFVKFESEILEEMLRQ